MKGMKGMKGYGAKGMGSKGMSSKGGSKGGSPMTKGVKMGKPIKGVGGPRMA